MQQTPNNTFEIKPIETRDLYCVYTHSIPPYQTIFYIGVTKLSDAFSFRHAYRNNYYRAAVTEETPVRITILGISRDPVECNAYMRILFQQLKPIANIKGHEVSGKTLIKVINGPNAGKVYETQKDAASFNGISPQALANHLNGLPGYETVRGLQFQRGIE